MSRRIVVTGGTGLIGSALVESLTNRGDTVLALRRGSSDGQWDPEAGVFDPSLLSGADAVVNLGGAGIGEKRWTSRRKGLILASRVGPTALLAGTIATLSDPPRVFVSASAIGYYGDTGDVLADESSPVGTDFQAQVCEAWERAAQPAANAGVRTVHPRTGIVLSDHGGALKPMAPLFKMGVGGKLGDGSQWWSWISLRDEVRALEHLIDADLAGPVNLVAPNPVRNINFTKTFGSVLGRPTMVRVPKVALDLRLGKELAESLGYGSARVAPSRLVASGFTFTSQTVEQALAEAFAK